MSRERRQSTYILHIWQETSEIAPPGEWRGVLRSLDGRKRMMFKSAQELWKLLTQSEIPAQPEIKTYDSDKE